MSEPTDPLSGGGDGRAPDAARPPSTPSVDGAEQAAFPAASEAQPFPVVGVGASAGGVEALEAFFGGLQPTGMAFVVVQHMAADKQSHLPEILGRVTRLPVVQATDGLTVEPDHVYVIPPGANLALFEGKLHLIELAPGSTHGAVLPVDFFFHSLANECGARCMGVVLSGTGADGMHGLQDIREAGGLTFAQDPSTARFSGMPSAAAVGADAVLSPEGIAQELERISRHPYLRGSIAPQNDESRKKLFILVRSAFGNDLSLLQVRHRRAPHRAAHGAATRSSASTTTCASSRRTPDELKTLYRDMLINVTSFFRDGEPFEVAPGRGLPAPHRAEEAGRRRSAIWVPGCATGEEAYSHRRSASSSPSATGRPEYRIQIFATDVDDDADRPGAAPAIYPTNIAADVSPERLRRFFQRRRDTATRSARRSRDWWSSPPTTSPATRRSRASTSAAAATCSSTCRRRCRSEVLRILHYALEPEGFLMLGTQRDGRRQRRTSSRSSTRRTASTPRGTWPASRLFELGRGRCSGDVRTPRPPSPDALRPLANLQHARRSQGARALRPRRACWSTRTSTSSSSAGAPGRTSSRSRGPPRLNLLKLARPELHVELRTAIHRALASTTCRSSARGVQLTVDGGIRSVSIEVLPLRDAETSHAEPPRALPPRGSEPRLETIAEPPVHGPTRGLLVPMQLERELASTKDYLQSTIEELETANEELKSANEELQSANEELQSTNEELETSKEELQTTNEELTTVNDELQQPDGGAVGQQRRPGQPARARSNRRW